MCRLFSEDDVSYHLNNNNPRDTVPSSLRNRFKCLYNSMIMSASKVDELISTAGRVFSNGIYIDIYIYTG